MIKKDFDKPTGEDAGADASDTDVIRALEQELGVEGIVNVFRASLALAKQVAVKTRAEAASDPAPIPADEVREALNAVVGLFDNDGYLFCSAEHQTAVLSSARAALARPSAPGEGLREAGQIADRVVLDVCELPDRTSPDDWPEALLVTSNELHGIVSEHVAAVLSRLDTAVTTTTEVTTTT